MGRVLGVVLAACALLLTSCATKLTAEQRSSLRRVGVVSVMGDKVHGAFRGTTVFGNREVEESAPDFAIDQTAEQTAVRRLSAAGVQARPLSSARTPLVQALPTGSYVKAKDARVAQTVSQLCATNNVDGLVIIRPGEFGPNDITPVKWKGVGRSGGNVFGIKSHAHFGVLNVLAYDRAGTRLVTGNSWPGGGLIEEFDWRERLADHSPEERAILREKIQADVDKKVTDQLKKMGL